MTARQIQPITFTANGTDVSGHPAGGSTEAEPSFRDYVRRGAVEIPELTEDQLAHRRWVEGRESGDVVDTAPVDPEEPPAPVFTAPASDVPEL